MIDSYTTSITLLWDATSKQLPNKYDVSLTGLEAKPLFDSVDWARAGASPAQPMSPQEAALDVRNSGGDRHHLALPHPPKPASRHGAPKGGRLFQHAFVRNFNSFACIGRLARAWIA